jgi:hypothetical protein
MKRGDAPLNSDCNSKLCIHILRFFSFVYKSPLVRILFNRGSFLEHEACIREMPGSKLTNTNMVCYTPKCPFPLRKRCSKLSFNASKGYFGSGKNNIFTSPDIYFVVYFGSFITVFKTLQILELINNVYMKFIKFMRTLMNRFLENDLGAEICWAIYDM